MTTNKPEVVAYAWQCHGRHSTVDKKFADELVADGERVDPLIRLSDYEALQAELETVKKVAYGNIELLERNEALQAECEKLRKGLDAVQLLIDNSYGVAGLHLNGNIAPWSDLCEGGRFEEWLSEFDAAMQEASHDS